MRIGRYTTSNGIPAYEEIMDKIDKGQEVFLEDTSEDVAVRIAPGEYYFAKRHGQDEHQIRHSTQLISDALAEANEITREQYDNY